MDDVETDINAKIDEYHLMVEEVLGGMDIMISRLDQRLHAVEDTLNIHDKNKLNEKPNDFTVLRDDLNKLKIEVTEGLNLAFRKINE